jgi:hypothetical protein
MEYDQRVIIRFLSGESVTKEIVIRICLQECGIRHPPKQFLRAWDQVL